MCGLMNRTLRNYVPKSGRAEMRFGVGVRDFLQFCAMERQLSSHTIQAYASDLADFGKWLPKRSPRSQVAPATLKRYLEHLIGERNLTTATVRRRFACLRAFFRRQASLGGTS